MKMSNLACNWDVMALCIFCFEPVDPATAITRLPCSKSFTGKPEDDRPGHIVLAREFSCHACRGPVSF